MKKNFSRNASRLLWGIPLAAIATHLLFAPVMTSAAGPTIRPGTTTTYGILAGSTITNTGATTISGTAGGDVGLFPGTSYTGSASVTRSGTNHITDSAASIAQTDLVTAYNDLGVPSPTILSSPDLAGRTLLAGTYAATAGTLANSGNVILDAQGDPTAVFVFQAASTAITSVGSTMTLANGAQACNVYWRVGSSATIGVNSTFIGHVYALTSITANTGASITGQLLARNGAVTLDTNTIRNNACTAAATTSSAASGVTTVAPTRTTVAPGRTTVAPGRTTVAPGRTTVAPGATTTTPESDGALPQTGAYTETLVFLAVVLVILGIVKIVVDRRRF
jgi:type VI secretion system secreted protein VgrG